MNNLGAASILIELKNNTITVKHGTDGDILKQFPASDNSWDHIWQGINNAQAVAALYNSVQIEEKLERTQIAEYFLVTALEGGSNYWVDKFQFVTVDEDPAHARVLKYPGALEQWRNGGAILVITELETEEHYNVQPYDILASAERAAEECKMSLNEFLDHHDAGDADDVLQLACFSEIIYG